MVLRIDNTDCRKSIPEHVVTALKSQIIRIGQRDL